MSLFTNFLHHTSSRSITQTELARLTKLTRNTIRSLHLGKGNLQNLLKVMDALGLQCAARGLPGGDNIGKQVETLRKRQKLSQTTLGEQVGVTRQTIDKLEKQCIGRVDTLSAVFDALGLKVKLTPVHERKRFIENAANSSTSDEWYTPKNVLTIFYDALGGVFDLDPCSPTRNAEKAPVKARKYYTQKNDGLSLPWHGVVFMNPPYSDVSSWTKKAMESCGTGQARTVIGLVPARTDTRWWNNNCAGKADILFLQGRLKFGSQTNSAPFPSALIFWNAEAELIAEVQKGIPSFHMPKLKGAAE
ncbi:putative DNA-binding helix-turn-helix protein [Candidatus Terasakiella magnetica]|uniref:Putative DNA-binding helix-turn-helix protein n=1 Tax=Candidatus Terasakiella magnetica TaxID=1867952 RepID=A0A1C3RH07_9PROT|nr:DNA N-6-adenine-methyltransferase [Candidatus Terasakiella magnetica]SCA56538.1 putative DNA-binding helix-turn-helix protein [Candidatus Terasakiella magnetica]